MHLSSQCHTQVGGGTKTRRPVAIHMTYNPACSQPRCFLVAEDSGELQEMSLEELQGHIQAANEELAAVSSFSGRDIVVRIDFKYSPNLTIIDTPGLLSVVPSSHRPRTGSATAPVAGAGGSLNPAQSASRAVEALVRSKMERKDLIILALEDTCDWCNATTRKLVAQVDPEFSRTVLVSTKLDTKLPQFSRGRDVADFLFPPGLDPLPLGGGPFFTSVPAGRVGLHRECVFRTNEQYREAVTRQEAADLAQVEQRLGRTLDANERGRVGVSQLRSFLERLLQRRYLEHVPHIVPVLEKEHRNAGTKLADTLAELQGLTHERLRERGRSFYAHFVQKIPLLMRGTVAAPPDKFGETLADERTRGGTFVADDGRPLAIPPGSVPNGDMRLFGGAQYHRALEEFRAAAAAVACPPVRPEEIVNACGVDEAHSGVNYTRTACVIAVSKARDALEPLIAQVGFRLAHVLRRLLPISLFLVQRDGRFLNGQDLFVRRVGATWHAFIERTVRECQAKVLEDLQSTTEFVSWSLHAGNAAALRSVMGAAAQRAPAAGAAAAAAGGSGALVAAPGSLVPAGFDALEHGMFSRNLGDSTADVVSLVVAQIFEGCKAHFVQSCELKFNCFFLLPCINSFPAKLREEIEAAMDEDLDSVFDVAAVRAALEARKAKLESELRQMESIQAKFSQIHSQLSRMAAPGTGGASDEAGPAHSTGGSKAKSASQAAGVRLGAMRLVN